MSTIRIPAFGRGPVLINNLDDPARFSVAGGAWLLSLPLAVALAIVADAWSRTYRSHVVTFSDKSDDVEILNGILSHLHVLLRRESISITEPRLELI